MDDLHYSPVRPVVPPRPAAVDLSKAFGPQRVRWGKETPIWIRSNGFEPAAEAPAVVEDCLLSMYGDWWVYCRTPLLSRRGRLVKEVGLLLPPGWVTGQ